MTTTDKILASLAAGIVISVSAVVVKDIDGADVTKETITAETVADQPAKYLTAPVLDAKTLEVITPAGSLHRFGNHEPGNCLNGDRYTVEQWTNTTIEKLDPAEFEPCYSQPVQITDNEGGTFVQCQMECSVWLAMQTPQDADDGGPIDGGDSYKPPVKPPVEIGEIIIKK